MPLLILISIVTTYLSLAGFLETANQPRAFTLSPWLLLSLLACLPLLAWIHSTALVSKSREWVENLLHLVWFLASMTLLLATDWLELVRTNLLAVQSLQLLVAMAPFLLSLFLIWLGSSLGGSNGWRKAWHDSTCRLKVHVLTILIPLTVFLVFKDFSTSQMAEASMTLQIVSFIFGMVLLTVFMPSLIAWILPTHSISNTALGQQLSELAKSSGTSIADIRIWGTGNRISNALLVGMSSWTRTVLLTDRLIRELELDEIKAVFLHEIGHANRHHLIQRFAAAALPFLLIYSIGEASGVSQSMSLGIGMFVSVLSLAAIARFLEYDADQFAVEQLAKNGITWNAYQNALLKILAENPKNDRHSWLHPRISDRIARIRRGRAVLVEADRRQL